MIGVGRSVGGSLVAPALVLHAAAWFAMLAHGDPWWGDWGFAVEQAAGSVIIVGPLLAALTANGYARRRETSLPQLVAASVHPFRGWFAPAVRFWLLATVNLVVLLAELAVAVTVAGPPLRAWPLVVLPYCAVMLAVHALVGMAIGLQLGPRLAGAVAGTVSFGLFLLAVANLAPEVFITGGATSGLAGMRYRWSVQAVLVLAGLALVVGVAATSWWPWRGARARMIVAVGAFATVTVLSQGIPVTDLDRRFEAVQVQLRCRGSAPEVCVAADTPRVLPAASRGMSRLIGPLRDVGVELPRRWVDYWGQPTDRRVGMLALRSGAELGTRVARADLIRSLTMPATCAGFFDNRDTQRSLDVRLLLGRWIAFRNRFGDTARAGPWFSSPESEAWVRATYAKLRSCDLGGLRFPTSGP